MKKKRAAFYIAVIVFSMGQISANPSTFVDDKGVMRWTETNEQVCAFGLNYSMPFSSWREHERRGAFNKEAVDADVHHIARMGLDGYRIHLWETYITDFEGNLVNNIHLQYFDYLLFKLKERDIKIFITAMTFFGGSSTGFQNKYGGKHGCLTNPEAWPAQENYLAQLVSHVNPYTGIAYKDDPDIIGFEINNEPVSHSARPDLTREYIDRMTAAIRGAGCEKPLFYNISHNINQIDKFCADDIQGGTSQWYPTCLNGNHTLKGNHLPTVDQFVNPFSDHPRFKNMAKIIYELSPADTGDASYMFAAMARSLKEAGFQFAAQFAYIPMNVAYSNFRWQTHFLNLAYVPKRGIGMMVAKEAFHHVPLGKSYGRYPDNNTFDVFRVSYEENLAEMVSDEKFIYSNATKSSPPKPEKLMQVAGVGCSPIVNYPGTGAYFLDKLEDGVWRLEVMPDAILVNDPHFTTALDKEVAVIQWREWPMELELPDLGEGFGIKGLNQGNSFGATANGRRFLITPGAYLLTREGKKTDWKGSDRVRNIRLDEFHAPAAHCKQTYVVHAPPMETTAGAKLDITATIVSPNGPERVDLVIVKQREHRAVQMKEISPYRYTAQVPAAYLASTGLLRYFITVGNGNEFETFPVHFKGNHPLNRRLRTGQTNILPGNPYTVKIVNPTDPICLYEAGDWEKLSRKDSSVGPNVSENTGRKMTFIKAPGRGGEPAYQFYCRERIEMRMKDLNNKKELAVLGYALDGRPCTLQLTMIMRDATVYGGRVVIQPEEGRYVLPLSDFKVQELRLVSPPLPGFQPRQFENPKPSAFRLDAVDSLQIIVSRATGGSNSSDAGGVAIERILLQ